MKKFGIFLLAAFFAMGMAADAREISGRITCQGEGIGGVVVSDGFSTSVTNGRGDYVLDTDNDARFVFISTPAGYSSPVKDNVVRFYHALSPDTAVYDFTIEKKAYSDWRHNIIAISDQQLLDTTEIPQFAKAVEDIAASVKKSGKIETTGLCCGDIVFNDHSLYGVVNSMLGTTGIPFRNVMGNHDMKVWGRSYETSVSAYEAVFGPAYYSFNIGKIHYVMLNDNFFIGRDYFYIGYIDEKQLQWLESDLSHVPEGSTVFVSMHIPTTLSPSDRERFVYGDISEILANKGALYSILKPYRVHILSGHIHTLTNQVISPEMFEHNLAALSGALYCGPICTDGTPAGYAMFEIDGDDVRWKWKSIGYDENMQMKVYCGEKYPELDGYVVANVWNYDPEWKVEYFENGKKVCDMEQFTGFDPDAYNAYHDSSKLKHSFVEPLLTDHLFRARPGKNARSAEIRVTDRFGNVYVHLLSCMEE